MQEITTTRREIVRFRQGIQERLRMRILEVIEVLLDEELSEALGCEAYQRVEGRRGYSRKLAARRGP